MLKKSIFSFILAVWLKEDLNHEFNKLCQYIGWSFSSDSNLLSSFVCPSISAQGGAARVTQILSSHWSITGHETQH